MTKKPVVYKVPKFRARSIPGHSKLASVVTANSMNIDNRKKLHFRKLTLSYKRSRPTANIRLFTKVIENTRTP